MAVAANHKSRNSKRSDESRFTLWNHDSRIRRRYAGERCLPECVIERHSGLIPGVMVWGVISYHGRSNLLRFEGNLNSNRYVHEVLQPEVVPFLQGIHGAVFQQDNTRPHVAKTVRDFCSAQHMQLLPWPAYSPNMSPIEHVWDLVGQRLARDPHVRTGGAAQNAVKTRRVELVVSWPLPKNYFGAQNRRNATLLKIYSDKVLEGSHTF
ncbi:transposable element Tc1 transposase [Trichonephila clavipes]|nr:transposable element Tc1 transposase [Trichonephila clavipes]